jgi:hypothetical protein
MRRIYGRRGKNPTQPLEWPKIMEKSIESVRNEKDSISVKSGETYAHLPNLQNLPKPKIVTINLSCCTPPSYTDTTKHTISLPQSQPTHTTTPNLATTPTGPIMAGSSKTHAQLIEQFEALMVKPNESSLVSLDLKEVREVAWGKCILIKIVTTRQVSFYTLRESLHKNWNAWGFREVVRFQDDMYVVHFNNASNREKVVALGPWHFRPRSYSHENVTR